MIHIKNTKTLEVTGLPKKYADAVKKKLSLENPVYIRKIKLKTPMWGTKRWIRYYKEEDGVLYLPVGFKTAFIGFLERKSLEYTYTEDKVAKNRKTGVTSKIELRDYQVPLLDTMFDNDCGIIHLSTGGGKSVIALEYAARTTGTVTIIVKDTNLLHQISDECKKFLNIEPGLIGDGNKEIKDITISTIQTLQSDDELLQEIAKHTTTLIVDECHEMITAKRRKVLSQFSASKQFGMTATPYKSEESRQTDAIGFVFGEIIASHEVEQMKPTVRVYATHAYIPVLPNYHDMVAKMIDNEERNGLIRGIATAEILSGSKVLILTKRVAHAEHFYNTLGNSEGVYHIHTEMKERGKILKEMKDGIRPFSCIIGTTQLLGTGFDIPTLDRLFLVGDMKSNVLTVQTTGRILRILDGKDPIIYDFVDEKNGMLKAQYFHRKKVYKEKGWKIDIKPSYPSQVEKFL